jgi:hypothetical protein
MGGVSAQLGRVPLNLTKVAVGCASVEALRNRLARRVTVDSKVRVPTRMRPKRGDELIGGQLYWIVKHRIVGGITILAIEDRSDGRIDFVCAPEFEPITPVPKRAHQGWRYYEHEAAKIADDSGIGDLPPGLYGKLSALKLV